MGLALVGLLVPLVLTACSGGEEDRTVVAYLAADADSTRGRAVTEALSAEVQSQCRECQLVTRDAAGRGESQRDQVTEVVGAGADVIILEAAGSAAPELIKAAGKVPVVTLDRLVPGARAHVGVDREAAGSLIAEELTALSPKRARVVLATGADGSAAQDLATVVADSLGPGMRVVAREADPARAGQVARRRGVDVVVTGDDADAEVVGDAFGTRPRRPLISGSGGDLDAVRRVVLGTQALTVHVRVGDEAVAAARAALDLAGVNVEQPEDAPAAEDVDGVPTVQLDPLIVTLQTLTNTVVREGIFTLDEICSGETARRCTELGFR